MSETVKQQFIDEAKQLDDYILYMQENFYFRFSVLKRIDGTEELEKYVVKYVFESNSPSSQMKNYRILKKLISGIEELICFYKVKRDEIPEMVKPRYTAKVKRLFEEGNFKEYMEASYFDNSKSYYEYLLSLNPSTVKREIDNATGSEEYYSEYTVKDYERAIKIIQYEELIQEQVDLVDDYNLLKDYPIHFSLYDMYNPVNIYRQSFISIMASFDATVFDLFKKIYQNNFLRLLKLWEKVRLHLMSMIVSQT